MKRPRLLEVIAVVLVVGLIGALFFINRAQLEPNRIPSAPIDRITVTDLQTQGATAIDNPREIQASIAFLTARRRGWRKPWDTFPSPGYQVEFESHGVLQYVVWIGIDGTNWIGYREGGKAAPDNVLRTISAEERSAFLKGLEKN